MSKRRKKILLYTRPLVPPWDEASKNMAYEIAKNSKGFFEFHVLTSKKYSAELMAAVKKSKNKKVVAESVYKSNEFDSRAKKSLLFRLFRLNLVADIIHFLFTPRELTSALIRARLSFSKTRSIQTIATIDDGLIKDQRKLKKILFGDLIVAQSQHTKNKLKKAGIENVRVVYPGIDLDKFYPGQKDKKIMKKLDISPSDFVILFAGEYTRLNAVDDIVDALEILIDEETVEEKNYKVIFALRIKSDEDLQKKHRTIEYLQLKGLGDRVAFLDMCLDMPALYRASDVNIFPAQRMVGKFDIPFVIIEAMACGKPVIVSGIPVLKEFVKNEQTGLVVKKAQPVQLASAIKRIKIDDKLREKLSNSGFEYVKENFDVDKNVKIYDILYENL
ncbi:MAG: glycosyltransferase family 4 protein [Patescibacteria group bacterium]|nr:glycosyltransferase family 4 protein [Patescibacteria group bacterium]